MGGVLYWEKKGCLAYSFDAFFCSMVCQLPAGSECTPKEKLQPGNDVCYQAKIAKTF